MLRNTKTPLCSFGWGHKHLGVLERLNECPGKLERLYTPFAVDTSSWVGSRLNAAPSAGTGAWADANASNYPTLGKVDKAFGQSSAILPSL